MIDKDTAFLKEKMAGAAGSKSQSQTLITSRFTDNNRAMMILSITLLLLLVFAISVAALVKVILLENMRDDRYKDVANELSDLRKELDEFSLNVTSRFAEHSKRDENMMKKILGLFRESGIHADQSLNPPTWTKADELCKNEGRVLCSVKDLFPEPGIFYSKEEYTREEWVPISDEFNDWIQIGNLDLDTFGRGTYKSIYGHLPGWGETSDTGSKKKRIFCCTVGF